jgi:S1-C subfamily serine protease
MKKKYTILMWIIPLIVIIVVFFWFCRPCSQDRNFSIDDVVAQVENQVVDIVVTEQLSGLKSLFFSGKTEENGMSEIGGGTGFVLDDSGLIVTCDHILAGEKYTILSAKGNKYEADVIRRFPDYDVAFLRVEENAKDLDHVKSYTNITGSGEFIFIIGNSLGYYTHSFKAGYISGKEREVVKEHKDYKNLTQLDMPIDKGDSGAPVFTKSGQVMGMVTSYDNRSPNIGFALPIKIIEELKKEI